MTRAKPPRTWEKVDSGIYKRWKTGGEWEYVIRFWSGGKEIRETIFGRKLYLARKALADRRAAVAEGRHHELEDTEPTPTLREYRDEYLEWAKAEKKSWKRDRSSLGHLVEHLGDRQLDRISQVDVQRYKDAQRQEQARPSHDDDRLVSGPTVNRELSCLSKLYKIAASRGVVPEGMNPTRGVPRYDENTDRWNVLSAAQVAALIREADDDFRPVLVAALTTGMRKGEILGLEWRDVDFQRRMLRLRSTKSGSPRDVPINDQLMRELARLHRKASSGRVFVKANGEPWANPQKAWERAKEAAGVHEDVWFHDLRHTAATRLMDTSHPFVAADVLGHKSEKTTKRYSHVPASARHHAARTLEWDEAVSETVSDLDEERRKRSGKSSE